MSGDHERVRMMVPAPYLSTGFAPIWLAKTLGYDTEEGIALDFDLAGSGSPKAAVEAVVSGRGDMTFVNIIFALLALDRGVPLLPFYAFVRKQNRSFSVLRESPIRTVAELKGQTIGLHFDDPELRQFAEAVLVEAGLNPAQDVRFEPLPGSPLDATRMVGALRGRQVDAVWQLDIFSGLMEAEGILVRHLPSAIDRLSPSSTLIAMASALQRRSAVFGAVGRAVAKATLFAMSNPEEAIRLVWRDYPSARPQPGTESAAWRQELAALKVRLNGHRIDDQPLRKWGAITEAEIEGWLRFLRKTQAVSGRLAAANCFYDGLIPTFNTFAEAGSAW